MNKTEKALKVERLLSTTMDTSSHATHKITKKDTQQRNRSESDLTTHLNNIKTDFSGEARVGQVLRWVNTSALLANDGASGKQRTPESQAAVVGGRILMGTNAEDDSAIPDKLRNLVSDNNTYTAALQKVDNKALRLKTTTESEKEKYRVNRQESRHLTQLRQFVSDSSYRKNFIDTAMSELRSERDDHDLFKLDPKEPISLENATGIAKRYTAFDDKMRQTRSMLTTIAESLDTGNTNSGRKVEMAPVLKGQHAEQRVIEHIQKNQVAEEAETRKVRNKPFIEPSLPFNKETTAEEPSSYTSFTPSKDHDYRSEHVPNRSVDPWSGVASYTVPKQNWNLNSEKRKRALARLEEYNNPKPKDLTGDGRVNFIASERTVIDVPRRLESNKLTIALGGTKPPCDMCETTEQARHAVAMKDSQSPMVITRFEDKSNPVGIQFTGTYQQSVDKRVHNGVTQLLKDTTREPRAKINTRKRADSFHG